MICFFGRQIYRVEVWIFRNFAKLLSTKLRNIQYSKRYFFQTLFHWYITVIFSLLMSALPYYFYAAARFPHFDTVFPPKFSKLKKLKRFPGMPGSILSLILTWIIFKLVCGKKTGIFEVITKPSALRSWVSNGTVKAISRLTLSRLERLTWQVESSGVRQSKILWR